jgi:hypothetical protein
MRTRKKRRIGLAWWLPLAWCCGGAVAHAIPAPVPIEKLEASAHAIVEGTVVSTTYVKATTRGDYVTAHFRGELKISRVSKGELKPGQTLPLRWGTERWIGKGLRPVGRSREPSFIVCERVRVYLYRLKHKGRVRYTVGGRRLVKPPSTYKSPSAKQKTLRCVEGKVR